MSAPSAFTLVRKAYTLLGRVAEAFLPGPADDLMAVAEAAGVAVQPASSLVEAAAAVDHAAVIDGHIHPAPAEPSEEELLAAERRHYHLAMCKVTELMADNRLLGMADDFTLWATEGPVEEPR